MDEWWWYWRIIIISTQLNSKPKTQKNIILCIGYSCKSNQIINNNKWIIFILAGCCSSYYYYFCLNWSRCSSCLVDVFSWAGLSEWEHKMFCHTDKRKTQNSKVSLFQFWNFLDSSCTYSFISGFKFGLSA